MTSFCNSRSFKDLALLSALLDWDFFFLGILVERRQLNWRRLLLLKSHYSVNVFNTKKRPKLGQNITNVRFHDKPLIFFYFCDLDFIDYCLNFRWYSRKWWQKKLKLWWYSWKAKKKIETTWCPGWALEPPFWPSAEYFIFAFHETTKVSIFVPPFFWK